MKDLIPFDFNSHAVRVVTDGDGDPWFVLADVCSVLEINNPSAVASRLDDDEKNTLSLAEGNRGNPNVTIINESGLYSVVLRSDKPKAKPFKRWVTHEVLPSIRKTGSYSTVTYAESLRLLADQVERNERLQLERDNAVATKAEIGSRREATAMATASVAVKKVDRLEKELDKSKQYCTIKRMQMIHHGQKFNWRELKAASIEMELPPIAVFDQNYGTVKAYHVDVWLEVYAVSIDD